MILKNTPIRGIIGDIMIKINSLIKNARIKDIPKDTLANLEKLIEKLNIIEAAYGKTLVITSGYRTKEDQIRVYAQKGITDMSKIPMGSKHISGQAVDISDPNGEFKAWIMENISLFEELGIYMEAFEYTKNWVHMQIIAPKSGSRFFKP